MKKGYSSLMLLALFTVVIAILLSHITPIPNIVSRSIESTAAVREYYKDQAVSVRVCEAIKLNNDINIASIDVSDIDSTYGISVSSNQSTSEYRTIIFSFKPTGESYSLVLNRSDGSIDWKGVNE